MEFSAVFIHEDSYLELLEKAEPLFHLNMFHKNRKFPFRDQSYMFLSFRDPAFNQGVKVNLDIKGYAYLEGEYLVALVHLKTNFTDFMNPHIILANRADLSDDYIRKNLKGKIIPLSEPLNIKGKININVMPFKPTEEPFKPAAEPFKLAEEPFKLAEEPFKLAEEPFKPAMKQELTIKLIPHPLRETTEKTLNEPGVFQGPRGGKYQIVDGKKKYLKMY